MNRIPLYPVIKEIDIVDHILYEKITYNYIVNGNTKELIINEDVKNEYILTDENQNWSMEEHGFTMSLEFKFRSIQDLKGKYICRGTKIGLGLEWSSSTSKLRGIYPLGNIEHTTDNPISKIIKFSSDTFRGVIQFRLVLYILTPGFPMIGEEHYANQIGQIIGEFKKFRIILDGQASLFPILYVSNNAAPLWTIELTYDDPYNEKFFDCFTIYLNQAHKDFKFIDANTDDYNSGFLREVLSSSIVQLIILLKNDNVLNDLSSKHTSGDSLVDAINRYKDDYGWRFDKLDVLQNDIKLFFDKEFK
jgi:hypothetical protein